MKPGEARAADAGLLALATAYAWWATSLRPFTEPALAATLAGGTMVVALGISRSRLPALRARRPGALGWGVLAVVLAGWELASFLQHPRARHPTISSLADDALRGHPVRALAMVAWLAIGAWLARPAGAGA